jgi:hypothetical protein
MTTFAAGHCGQRRQIARDKDFRLARPAGDHAQRFLARSKRHVSNCSIWRSQDKIRLTEHSWLAGWSGGHARINAEPQPQKLIALQNLRNLPDMHRNNVREKLAAQPL